MIRPTDICSVLIAAVLAAAGMLAALTPVNLNMGWN